MRYTLGVSTLALLASFYNPIASAQNSDDVAAGEDAVVEFDTVVVTARKRAESIQDVPLTVANLDSEELETRGIDNLQGLSSYLPGLNIGFEDIGLEISIRGVGNRGGNPAVALHQDGVFTTETSIPLFDVERVEVLYGPSGTLYGRNSTGGSINVITKAPSDEFELIGQATIGNFNAQEFEFVGNVPINEQLAARLSVVSRQRDGFLTNTFNDQERSGGGDADTVSGRLQVLFEPTENLRFLLRGGLTEVGGIDPGGSVPSPSLVIAEGGTLFAPDTGRLAALTPFQLSENADDPRAFPFVDSGQTNFEEKFVSLEANWDFADNLSLTYIGGYSESDAGNSVQPQIFAFDNTVTINQADFSQTSHELRLASAGDGSAGTLDWMVGAFHYESDRDIVFTSFSELFGAGLRALAPDNTETSASLFANATYHVSDTLSLNAGIRQNSDETEQNSESQVVFGDTAFPAVPLQTFEADFDQTNWKIGADWEWEQGKSVYGLISTGYRPGGVNQTASAPLPTFEPEEVTAFEVGSKNQFLQGRLTANFSAFLYQFSDFQVISTDPADPLGDFFQNADGLDIVGLDAAFLYRDGPFQFNAAIELLDAEYEDGVTVFSRDTGALVDLSSATPSRAPDITASFGAEYLKPVPALNGDMRLRADVFASSEVGFSVLPLSNLSGSRVDVQSAYALTDLSLAYEHSNERFLVEGFVQNAFDEDVISGFSSISEGFGRVAYEQPRVFGIRLKVRN